MKRITFLLILAIQATVFSQEEQSPYDTLWAKVSTMLHRREYGSARATLESASKDPKYADFKSQIEKDDYDCLFLEQVQKVIEQQVLSISAGSQIKLNGIQRVFVRYDKSKRVLVTRFSNSDKERETALKDLRVSELEEFALKGLPDSPKAKYALGLLHATAGKTDRAKELFNQAASGGIEISRWLERLELTEDDKAVANNKPKKKENPHTGIRYNATKNNLSFVYPNGEVVVYHVSSNYNTRKIIAGNITDDGKTLTITDLTTGKTMAVPQAAVIAGNKGDVEYYIGHPGVNSKGEDKANAVPPCSGIWVSRKTELFIFHQDGDYDLYGKLGHILTGTWKYDSGTLTLSFTTLIKTDSPKGTSATFGIAVTVQGDRISWTTDGGDLVRLGGIK